MTATRSAKAKLNALSSGKEDMILEKDERRVENRTITRGNMPRLFPMTETNHEDKVESTKNSNLSESSTKPTLRPSSSVLPKPFPLRSVPISDTILASKQTKLMQKEVLDPQILPADPTPDQKIRTKPLMERSVVDNQKRTHTKSASGGVKSRREPVQSLQERRRRQPSRNAKIICTNRDQPPFTAKDISVHQAFPSKKSPSIRSRVHRKASERLSDGRSIDEVVKKVSDRFMKEHGATHAHNNVQLARRKMLPLPLGNSIPPRPGKGARQEIEPTVRKFTRRLSTDKDGPNEANTRESLLENMSPRIASDSEKYSARISPTRKTPSEGNLTSLTRSRRKLNQKSSNMGDKSYHPSPSNNSGRKVSISSAGSPRNGPARQTLNRVRKPIKLFPEEYDSESPQESFRNKENPAVTSEGESSSCQSDSGINSDDSKSEEDETSSESEKEEFQTKRGKTISEQALRNMVTCDDSKVTGKEVKDIETETKRKHIANPCTQKPVEGKSLARKTVARNPISKKAVSGGGKKGRRTGTMSSNDKQTVETSMTSKSIAGKSLSGKCIAGKTIPQMRIPRRLVHAGGIKYVSNQSVAEVGLQSQGRDGKTLRNVARNKVEKGKDRVEAADDDAHFADSNEKSSDSSSKSIEESGGSSKSDSGTEDSETEDSEDRSKKGNERRNRNEVKQVYKNTKTDIEIRRKEIRGRCSKHLKQQEKEEYSSSVREEFFLEMEYHMYLQRQPNRTGQVIGQLRDSTYLFEKNIGTLRLEGLESLGCNLEAQNYRSWLRFFRASGKVLHMTADPAWKQNYQSVLACLESALISKKTGEIAIIKFNESQLKFMTDGWQLLPRALEVLNTFSSEMFNIQTDGRGCQLQ